jgi:hypothetical protein
MSKGSRRKHSHKHHSRKRRGGGAPLASSPYPGQGAGQWNTSINGNPIAAAANSYKTLLSGIGAESGGAGQNPALASKMLAQFAMSGAGQRGGGRKGGSKRAQRKRRSQSQAQAQAQAQSQAQSQAQAQSQSGGMLATFGALLKEALVPLGLLAAQQSYGKSYDSKRRTRKNRS